ncbi:MAG: 16S rRNA (cytosine(967)-C(5))-methyltransferase RsmB [Oscillospiraceae bacterium]
MDKAREAAVFALECFRREKAWSAAITDGAITKYGLDSRSAALASNICLGVLQNLIYCDHYIDMFSSSPSKIEPKVRDILRCAVYQLLFMNKIPANAAVNEAVMQCKKLGYSRAAGFCNAVLRKIAAAADDALPEIPEEGTATNLSVKYSHPIWLAEYMINAHGYAFAEAFFAADNTVSEITLQVNTLRTTAAELMPALEAAGYSCRLHPWLPDCIVTSGNVSAMPGFDKGFFYVQDPAAKCAVITADLMPGMRVLDACAAPGGKSFAAAIAMHNDGEIISCDLSEKKIKFIKSGADRLGLDIIDSFSRDARQPLDDAFDVIISDVPCSGYGVIRKKPDIRYKDPDERRALPEIQSAILENLSAAVKPGGVLLYSTCTVFREENEDVVTAFLSRHPEYAAEGFSLPNGIEAPDGMLTFWPHIHGTDGFFVCKLRRLK